MEVFSAHKTMELAKVRIFIAINHHDNDDIDSNSGNSYFCNKIFFTIAYKIDFFLKDRN